MNTRSSVPNPYPSSGRWSACSIAPSHADSRPLEVKSVRSNSGSPGRGKPTSLSSGSLGWTSPGLSGGVDGGTMSGRITGFVSAG